MKESNHDASISNREGLDERSILTVVNRVHFSSGDGRILGKEVEVIGISVSIVVNRLFSFFQSVSKSSVKYW